LSEIKQQSIELIQSLPDDVTIDNIIEELCFKMQVDKGLEELNEGKGIDHEEVERRMSKWIIK
jgi:predicted transcriptional regulator